MWYKRMELEVWFDQYQFEVKYDIGESAVKTIALKDVNIDLQDVLLRYGYHKGAPDLRREIAKEYPGLSEENIVVTTGASEANFIVVSALVKPGEHVIIEHPNYPSLYDVPRSMGCDVSLFPLRFENQFKPNWKELEKMIRPDTKLISLTHPNNPTGSMITEDELKQVIELVEDRNIILMFDETYRQMAFGDTLLPAAASMSDNVVSISTMSKCYGLPGIRTGWIATKNQDMIDRALTIREQITISHNSLSEVIATKVLAEKETYLKSARERILSNRKVVESWMNEQTAFEWIKPEAGVVCSPRFKADVQVDYEAVYRRLAEEYKTFLVPGRCFEMDERFFRIGFGANPDDIKTGLANLNKALSDLT